MIAIRLHNILTTTLKGIQDLGLFILRFIISSFAAMIIFVLLLSALWMLNVIMGNTYKMVSALTASAIAIIGGTALSSLLACEHTTRHNACSPSAGALFGLFFSLIAFGYILGSDPLLPVFVAFGIILGEVGSRLAPMHYQIHRQLFT